MFGHDSEGLLHEDHCRICGIRIDPNCTSADGWDLSMCGKCYHDMCKGLIHQCGECGTWIEGPLVGGRCRECHRDHRDWQLIRAEENRAQRKQHVLRVIRGSSQHGRLRDWGWSEASRDDFYANMRPPKEPGPLALVPAEDLKRTGVLCGKRRAFSRSA